MPPHAGGHGDERLIQWSARQRRFLGIVLPLLIVSIAAANKAVEALTTIQCVYSLTHWSLAHDLNQFYIHSQRQYILYIGAVSKGGWAFSTVN